MAATSNPTACGSLFAHFAPSSSRLPSHRGCRRLLLDEHPVKPPKIAVIDKRADHVLRDLACALLIKPVPGRELKTAIGASQRSLETSMEKAVGVVDHGDTGRAAIRMAVGQPEEGHPFNLALPATFAKTASV
jgi:hypothetical protein